MFFKLIFIRTEIIEVIGIETETLMEEITIVGIKVIRHKLNIILQLDILEIIHKIEAEIMEEITQIAKIKLK